MADNAWWITGGRKKTDLQLLLEEAQRIGQVMRVSQIRINIMATVVEDLVAQVQATKGVQESAVAALNGLHAALEAAVASNDMAAVAAAVADLKANTDALAGAVAANPIP